MPKQRVSLDESLWIRGESIDLSQRNARSEAAAIRARGAKIFSLKGPADTEGLQRLGDLLRKSDVHVVLARLIPGELKAVMPLLYERKNFSIVVDDWWTMPHWLMRSAEYIIFRNYNGIAVRSGVCSMIEGPPPPVWLPLPFPLSWYGTFATTTRLPAIAISPLVNAWNSARRAQEPPSPERYIYFPFPINGGDVPLKDEPKIYDFANTGGTCGVWIMRDPYSSFHHTFANLYCDRKYLVDAITRYEGQPFTFYDWQRDNRFLPYDEYVHKSRQSRYLIATGGLHYASVPKFLEYACLGVPMIGRRLPYEYPWLDECMFEVDSMSLTAEQAKPRLQEAVERHPEMQANCLNWRDRLVKLYDINRLLEIAQMQIDGQPIPPGYLKIQPKPISSERSPMNSSEVGGLKS